MKTSDLQIFKPANLELRVVFLFKIITQSTVNCVCAVKLIA